MQARLILIKGRVQGIGFRAYVRKIAKPLNITGYAKNLSGGDVEILAGELALHFAVIGAGGIEEQKGVARGRGVHDDELAARLADDPREGLEDGDLLRAGGAEILFEQGAAGRVQ